MYRPLEITQWVPSQSRRKPKPPAKTRNRGKDSTDVNPYAGSPSIEGAIDEAMRPVADDGVRNRIVTSKATAPSDIDKKERPFNLDSAINIEAGEDSNKVSLNADLKAPFLALDEVQDTLPSASAMGASHQPILIPSDVDSDTDDDGGRASNEADASLPPAHELRISSTQSRLRRTSSSPVRRPDNRDDPHLRKPTLLDSNATYVDMTESPKSAPHSAIGSPTPAPESPGPYLTHPDLNGDLCQGDNAPASDTSTRHETIPESPRGSPGNPTLDFPEGQDLAIVDTTKPGAVDNGAILSGIVTSSSQSASDPSTSAHMSQPPILAPLETAEVSENSGDVPLSAAPSSCNVPGTRDASPERQLSPETTQVQGLAMTGCESNDVEVQAQTATSALSLDIPEPPSPSETPITRRRSRRQVALKSIRYDDGSDSDADGDSRISEDINRTNLRHKGHTSDLAAEESHHEGETSGEDEQCPRKRCRVSKSSTGSISHAAASDKGRASRRFFTRPTKRDNRSRTSGIPSPPLSQTSSTEVGAFLARYEEWPLENVSLKRIMENGRATFQLQFDWAPCTERGPASSADRGCVDSPSTRTVSRAKRALASRTHYTVEEDNLLLELKEKERLAWPEIHKRFTETYPGRSVQSLQVHYSTKLKRRERS